MKNLTTLVSIIVLLGQIKDAVGQFNPTALPTSCQSSVSSTEFTTVCGPYGGTTPNQFFNCSGTTFITQMTGKQANSVVTAIQFTCSDGTPSLYYDSTQGGTTWSLALKSNGISYVYLKDSSSITTVQYDSAQSAVSGAGGTAQHARDNGTNCPLTGIAVDSFVNIGGGKKAIETLSLIFKCPICPAGTQLSPLKNSCTPCPVGYYKPSSGVYACILCDNLKGEYCPTAGMTNYSCLAGYTLVNGICTPCLAGTYKSSVGIGPCSQCSFPLHCPNAGMTQFWCKAGYRLVEQQCSACPAGTYKSAADISLASSVCSDCVFPQSCPNEAMMQYFCGPGFELISGTCSPCPVNYYKSKSDDSRCVVCTYPQNCPLPGMNQFLCREGYQLVNGACVQCPPGTYKSFADTRIDQSICTPCDSTKLCPSSGMISFMCAGGHIFANNTCTACPINTYRPADLTGQSNVCFACVSPQLCPNQGMSSFFCPRGFQPAGNYCQPCQSGTFKPTNDGANCTTCVLPKVCPNNQMANFFCDRGFQRVNGSCIACPSGSYKATVSAQNCTSCINPQYCPNSAMSSFFCNPGFQKTNNSCSPCLKGTFKSTYGPESCVVCSGSQFCPDTGMSEVKCRAGFEKLSSDTCAPCQHGFYKSTDGEQNCNPCPPDSLCLPESGFLCKAGFEFNSTTATCEPCLTGFYKSLVNNTKCTPCPNNSICSPTEYECGPGYEFSNSAFEEPCQPCPSGFYKTLAGPQKCLKCPQNSRICTSLDFECSSGLVKSTDQCQILSGQESDLLIMLQSLESVFIMFGALIFLDFLIIIYIKIVRQRNRWRPPLDTMTAIETARS